MSNEIWAPLLSALSAIITAAITAYMQFRIASLNADVEKEKITIGGKRGKVKKPEKGEQIKKNHPTDVAQTLPKPKPNWLRIGLMAILVGAVVFVLVFVLITAIRTLRSKPAEPTPPPISLADAKVDFEITIGDDTQTVPDYGTLNLKQDDQIRIETNVTDANGSPYPHELAIKYFFPSGKSFSGQVAPYTAKLSDRLITVQIKDQVTGETITRTLRINVNVN